MLSPIQLLYYAWDISHKKSVSDDSRFTGVLSEARVDLNPHQVEAALFAFKSPLSKGAILADEVGLGKTIEAGIILSEMWAENKRNILIVVPASLRNQWNIELMEKFYLPSFILDSESFEEGQSQISKGEKSIYICSYNFAVTNAEYFKNIDWDLIVLDEAHKLRNVYKKSNVMANALRAAFRNYKKVLLTATPLQNNLKELYGLISIIDPEFFSSLDTFADQYNAVSTRDKAKYGELKGRIAHIIHRTLRNQVEEYVNFTKRTAFVQEYYPSTAEINLYNQVSDYLMREGTYGVPERQRPLLSLLVRKIMSSSAYALGYTLERFIHRLQEYKETGMLSSALACVNADYDGNNDEYDIYDNDSASSRAAYNDIDDEIEELRGYCKLARSSGEETKSKELLNALDLSFEKITKLGGQKKALIFTESRRTQEYLYKFLTDHGYRDKIVCFNGTNTSDEAKNIYRLWLMQYAGTNRISGSTVIDKKQAIVDTFKDKAEILIATEPGAEGINLQFCSLVVNYDMPWNPQRIEQRIGRCHRYGQKHDVVVVNFINIRNFADVRVFDLLSTKFKLFDDVFGASDEVLGQADTIDIESRIWEIYQQCRSEEEISKAFEELQADMQQEIEERMDEVRSEVLEKFDINVQEHLRMTRDNTGAFLSRYHHIFWELTKFVLSSHAVFNDSKHSFVLRTPVAGCNAGRYVLLSQDGDGIPYRLSHPLAQHVINTALSLNLDDVAEVAFSEDAMEMNASFPEYLQGESGWLILSQLSVSSLSEEQHTLFSAFTDSGRNLSQEDSEKLFLNGGVENALDHVDELAKHKLQKDASQHAKAKLHEIDSKNLAYFKQEENRIYQWEHDMVDSIEVELSTVKRNILQAERDARNAVSVQEKLECERKVEELKRKKRRLRNELEDREDEISQQRRKMIGDLEKRLIQSTENNNLFIIRWKTV